jgi:hypothetical protein
MQYHQVQLATTLHILLQISHTMAICTILELEAPFRTLEARLSRQVAVG